MGYTAHAFAELDMTKRLTLSLSQRRKLRHREGMPLVQGGTAGK